MASPLHLRVSPCGGSGERADHPQCPGLGMTYRRSSELFDRHMYLHEGLIAGGAAVLVLPGAGQALSPGGDKWGLILIGEAFLLLAAGFALSQRWLVVAGVLTIGGVAFRYFSAGEGRLPYWLTLGIAGLILLGFGVLLLSAREWWDRTRARIGHWWLEVGEEGPAPPAPPRRGCPSAPGSRAAGRRYPRPAIPTPATLVAKSVARRLPMYSRLRQRLARQHSAKGLTAGPRWPACGLSATSR